MFCDKLFTRSLVLGYPDSPQDTFIHFLREDPRLCSFMWGVGGGWPHQKPKH